ncbi:DUF3990 domain-containing protein [Clostridium tagluense]|nr:DUF3990 domain-containing protein [Clostridium tagluense]MCB2298609.1 DUF3990 domain-containing protein [Clostridium tagluense]
MILYHGSNIMIENIDLINVDRTKILGKFPG